MPENIDVPEESCSLWREAHTRAVFLAGSVAHGGHTLKQSNCEELQPRDKTHDRAVPEDLQTM